MKSAGILISVVVALSLAADAHILPDGVNDKSLRQPVYGSRQPRHPANDQVFPAIERADTSDNDTTVSRLLSVDQRELEEIIDNYFGRRIKSFVSHVAKLFGGKVKLFPHQDDEKDKDEDKDGEDQDGDDKDITPSHVINDFPIGKGDRFKNGTLVPRGLGMHARKLESILNVQEVNSALRSLASSFGDEVKLFTAPFLTYENRSVQGIIIAGSNPKPRVFLQGGIHGNERGGPDALVYFVADLLEASKAGEGLEWYHNKQYSLDEVRRALSAGMVVVPLLNPDGATYDHAMNSCWIKNRNPEIIGEPAGKSFDARRAIGVNINRNYDFLWDHERYFSPKAHQRLLGTNQTASEYFRGNAPMSEPETRNSAWIMEQNTGLSWFVDLRSNGDPILNGPQLFDGGSVLYGWGDDEMQSRRKGQNFRNRSYDGKRGTEGGVYKEYMDKQDLLDQVYVATSISSAMSELGGVDYRPLEAFYRFPTSGTSTDYALSRSYGPEGCGKNRVHGLALNFVKTLSGFHCVSYPDELAYHHTLREVGTGLMEILLQASTRLGDVEVRECP